MSPQQTQAFLSTPCRLSLQIQPKNSRQVHTATAYMSLSYEREHEESFVFRDLDFQLLYKI
jgi:hypothetical protein